MIHEFLQETKDAIDRLDENSINQMAEVITGVRERGGRMFLVGSGGGAGHASHACCDFRKLCGVESYAPYDNITELTARTNDDGWGRSLVGYLGASNFNAKDCLFVFSVGGGIEGISDNLVNAIHLAYVAHAKIIGIVGNEVCAVTDLGDAFVVIKATPCTPIVEGLQSVIWHLLVTMLQKNKPVW